jgi:hypothetical protein
MMWTESSGSGAGTGTTQAGAQGAETSGVATVQTGAAGINAGIDTANLVSRSDFDAISKKLNDVLTDNANYRKRLRAVVSGEEEDDDGTGKGKPDKNAERLDKLIQSARRDKFTSQITTAAVKAGATFPEQVVAILSIDEHADEDGNVKDVDKLIETTKSKYANLFSSVNSGPGNINGGAGGGSGQARTNADMNAEIRAFRRGRQLQTS